MSDSNSPLVVRGKSGHLIVPIVGIPAITIAASTYYRSHLPDFCVQNEEKIMLISGLLTFGLVVAAWFRTSRRLECLAGQIRYRSWLTDKIVAAAQISAATFETEISGSADQNLTEHCLALWSGHEPVLRFNTALWPSDGMAALLRALREYNPALRLDLAVERYVENKP